MKIVYLTCNYKFKTFFKFIELSQINNKNYLINFNIKKEKFSKMSKKRILHLFKKIYTILYDKKIFTIVLDKTLFENECLKEILKEYKIHIITGELIKKIITKEALNSITSLQEGKIKKYNVAILVNSFNYINKYTIEYLAANCKSTCIITNTKTTFLSLSDTLHEELGIYIPVITTPPKSSNLIINIDSNLNDMKLNNGSIVVDFSKNEISKNKKRNINYINKFSITIPDMLYINNFDSFHLCEAYFSDYWDNIEFILSKFNKEGFMIFPVK